MTLSWRVFGAEDILSFPALAGTGTSAASRTADAIHHQISDEQGHGGFNRGKRAHARS